ncbi:YveK family protein [uncultured Subdoligranulum sp.]|uniref:YveK family protein n=1 Tax=uncultured Subdoligranulum sp. TaxID=512298 RepID=UPI0025F9F0DB|nr:Wzz/FepE/Etk N-terminal domain-containing protein [uncultured Subdoligranulum sp.]
MEENQDYETIDLLELLGVLRQHILALLLTTVLAALAGFLVSSFVLTPQYQASALMIVNTRQDTSANVTSDQLTSASRLVSTYSIIVKSDTVLNQVIANLGLNMTYETLASKVEVSAVDETQVMEITVTDPNPDGARQVCEQITQVAPDAILTAVEAGSVKVISAASVDPDPVSPNIPRNTAIAGVLGLVVCVGILFLRVLLDNKINTEDDVTKHLGLTVIGVIPNYENGGKR